MREVVKGLGIERWVNSVELYKSQVWDDRILVRDLGAYIPACTNHTWNKFNRCLIINGTLGISRKPPILGLKITSYYKHRLNIRHNKCPDRWKMAILVSFLHEGILTDLSKIRFRVALRKYNFHVICCQLKQFLLAHQYLNTLFIAAEREI